MGGWVTNTNLEELIAALGILRAAMANDLCAELEKVERILVRVIGEYREKKRDDLANWLRDGPEQGGGK